MTSVGRPPATTYAQGRWWDLRPLDPAVLAQAGWFPLVEVTRPADTDTTTHDLSYTVVDGQPTQVWTERPWTAEELAARTAAANQSTLESKAAAALAANATDLAQAQTVWDAANTLANGTGNLTTAQLTTAVRQLAAGVRILAAHDQAQIKQLNALIRLTLRALDSIGDT